MTIDMSKFISHHRIFYHHTDAAQVVYYAAYLHLLEEARSEFLLSKGLSMPDYLKAGMSFPVVRVEIDYRASACYGDHIAITTAVDRIGNTSIAFAQEITRQNTSLVLAKTIWVCVGPDLKKILVPDDMRKALQ
jgi:acyl-CoA thioester hydrolase